MLIVITGIAAIWAFITLLALVFCIYANRRSRRETEESGRLARGHWKEDESAIEVRRVSEPFIRRAPPLSLPSTVGGNKAGKAFEQKEGNGVRHPGRAYHSATQRGGVVVPAPLARNKGQAVVAKGAGGLDTSGQVKQVNNGARRSHKERIEEGAVLPKKELKRIPRR